MILMGNSPKKFFPMGPSKSPKLGKFPISNNTVDSMRSQFSTTPYLWLKRNVHETISEPFVVPRFLNTTLRRRREYINSSQYNGQEVSNRLERNCLNRLQMGKFECFRYRAGTLHLFICLTLLLSRYICRRARRCGDASDRFYTSHGSASALCPKSRIKTTKQDCNFKSLKLGTIWWQKSW